MRHPLPSPSAAREIGGRILRLRTGRGLTQQQVAEAVGVCREVVSGWEAGSKHPSLGSLLLLGPALGVDPGELVRGLPAIDGGVS
jgi:transcriptional regulator with XRE-family HTH domain